MNLTAKWRLIIKIFVANFANASEVEMAADECDVDEEAFIRLASPQFTHIGVNKEAVRKEATAACLRDIEEGLSIDEFQVARINENEEGVWTTEKPIQLLARIVIRTVEV